MHVISKYSGIIINFGAFIKTTYNLNHLIIFSTCMQNLMHELFGMQNESCIGIRPEDEASHLCGDKILSEYWCVNRCL